MKLLYSVQTHRSAQLQVVVTLYSLLGHRLGDALRVATLELSRQQVSKPTLEQRSDSAHEEQPHSPAWRPEAATRALADGTLLKYVS